VVAGEDLLLPRSNGAAEREHAMVPRSGLIALLRETVGTDVLPLEGGVAGAMRSRWTSRRSLAAEPDGRGERGGERLLATPATSAFFLTPGAPLEAAVLRPPERVARACSGWTDLFGAGTRSTSG